jgi:endoglucanase Acf2
MDRRRLIATSAMVILLLPARGQRAIGAEGVVQVGAGSYATRLPPGVKAPPATIYQTSNVRGKMPTNDWWSSLAWMKFSERQYPHPLAVRATPAGLQVHYPGPTITANRHAIFGFMPDGTGEDLVLGHSAIAEFLDARVDGFSDWFVRAALASGENGMTVSYGHGSPFVYATLRGGGAKITLPRPPKVWYGDAQSPTLGITVSGRHYGLFGPRGSTWSGLGGNVLLNHAGGAAWFSLAVLPEGTEEVIELFREHAHAHVVDTRFGARYNLGRGTVEATYTFVTQAHEGGTRQTLFALYPHQWRRTTTELLDYEYDSVRGKMKLGRGSSFATEMAFPGVLPALPDAGACDRTRLAAYLDEELKRVDPEVRDTYWDGKHLGLLASLVPLAEQAGGRERAAALHDKLRGRLETWLRAEDGHGRPKRAMLFAYDGRCGTLIGCPAAYGSDAELNDHHFHYGYFIKAAAELARRDPSWAAPGRFGGMVELLVRDVASHDRDDPMFPMLRCFDPYAGHSWASGHAKFGDGNNQESSSEAMNAWCAMVLWGEAAGSRAVRDVGAILYTLELAAIEEYWFDVHGTNHPADYPASVVTMIWGGKGANGTWFSANPEMVHGINWLPIHAGSLYLGRYPEYVEKNYAALVAENGGTAWDAWADLVWMYRALSDPGDALGQFNARPPDFTPEAGNSLANTYHWMQTLAALGQVDRTVSADYPLCAVFRKGDQRTYVVYNMGAEPRTVVFSDGTRLEAKGRGFVVRRGLPPVRRGSPDPAGGATEGLR